jgi:hypothetical protein
MQPPHTHPEQSLSAQFNAAESAASALKRINERVADNQLSSGWRDQCLITCLPTPCRARGSPCAADECGLLHRPTNDPTQDRWLDPEKTLAVNGIRTNVRACDPAFSLPSTPLHRSSPS